MKFLLALLGVGWETEHDDGIWLLQRNRYSGERRAVIPAARLRLLKPWHYERIPHDYRR